MIERIDGSIISDIKELKENSKHFNEVMDSVLSEEQKESKEYQLLSKEGSDIEKDLEGIISDEEKEEIIRLSEIQSYIKNLQDMIDSPESPEELKERAKRQIFLIRSSYTFEVFNELKPTMKAKTLRDNFIKLRRDAERKLDRNKHFKFHSAQNIEKHIKAVLPEELKSQSRVVASFIYAFIGSASLQPNGYAMFVFFLIRNIMHLERDFDEKEVFVSNLTKLARALQ
jgi:hypothetical protein